MPEYQRWKSMDEQWENQSKTRNNTAYEYDIQLLLNPLTITLIDPRCNREGTK